MLLGLYKFMMQASTPVLEAYLQKRLRAGKEDAGRTGERRGVALRPRGQNPLVWLHAASVGESLSLLSLIERIVRDFPSVDVMVTTGTVTSAALMAERLPQGAFHQYMPVDHPVWVARFLDHWQPDLALWAESEFWPNMLAALRARRIPAVLLNARMSKDSFRRWRWVSSSAQEILSTFDLCLGQNEAEATRLRLLGATQARAAANLKYAAAPLPVNDAHLAALRTTLADRPVVLWASTHDTEEAMAVQLQKQLQEKFPNVLTIIVPRHPARAQGIATMIETAGVPVARRSLQETIPTGTGIYLADTMGELGLFYRLCRYVVMGGSFADIGGHNPIEPAQLDCVIFFGPMTYNFLTIMDDLRHARAVVDVRDAEDLAKKVSSALETPADFDAYAAGGLALTTQKSGVIEKIMEDLNPYIRQILSTAERKVAQ